MNYEEFLTYVESGLSALFAPDAFVILHKVLKNNDMELDGISVLKKGDQISPTIYLNDYYTSYKKGTLPEAIVQELFSLFLNTEAEIPFDIHMYKDYSSVKQKLAFKLVSYQANQKLLKEVPYIKFLDLAIVFYVLLSTDSKELASIMVRKEHAHQWQADENSLYENALKNMPSLLPAKLRHMEDVICEFLSDESLKNPDCISEQKLDLSHISPNTNSNEISMYVLTNHTHLNGAASMLYKNLLKEFSAHIKENLYILPSSIHEVLIVPANHLVKQESLSQMVQEVNEKEVSEGERLSDHVYYYDRKTNTITL